MKVDKAIKATFNTNLIILNGFLVALLVGTILLMLPVSSASGNGTDFITALFTATTSLCVTGLVVVPTYAYWSIFGKVIILILIQLGGLGIISFTIGFLIIIGKKISLKERKMIQESYNLDSAQGVLKILRKIFGITVYINTAFLIKSFKTDNNSHKLHTVISGLSLAAGQFFLKFPIPQNCSITARPRVSAACSICIHLNFLPHEFSLSEIN